MVEKNRDSQKDYEKISVLSEFKLLLDCLEFAHGAIIDAIATEDGLDGSAGESVILMIEEQLEKHQIDFVKFKMPPGTPAI